MSSLEGYLPAAVTAEMDVARQQQTRPASVSRTVPVRARPRTERHFDPLVFRRVSSLYLAQLTRYQLAAELSRALVAARPALCRASVPTGPLDARGLPFGYHPGWNQLARDTSVTAMAQAAARRVVGSGEWGYPPPNTDADSHQGVPPRYAGADHDPDSRAARRAQHRRLIVADEAAAGGAGSPLDLLGGVPRAIRQHYGDLLPAPPLFDHLQPPFGPERKADAKDAKANDPAAAAAAAVAAAAAQVNPAPRLHVVWPYQLCRARLLVSSASSAAGGADHKQWRANGVSMVAAAADDPSLVDAAPLMAVAEYVYHSPSPLGSSQ